MAGHLHPALAELLTEVQHVGLDEGHTFLAGAAPFLLGSGVSFRHVGLGDTTFPARQGLASFIADPTGELKSAYYSPWSPSRLI